MAKLLRLALLAAAAWPCSSFSSFFMPAALGGGAARSGDARGTAPLLPRASPAPAHRARCAALLVCASGAPRRPPPPPPKKAAVGAGGARHDKVQDPQLQAGAWREDLGLGACRCCASPLPKTNKIGKYPPT